MKFQSAGESFCDWLTVSQTFNGGISKHTSTLSMTYDTSTGELQYEKFGAVDHRGSHDTNIRIGSDGYRLYLSGNIGRYGRPDNLFGYSLDDCKLKANQLLTELGLPNFTPGDFFYPQNKGDRASKGYTGALVSRVDMTTNFSVGSEAADYMHWLGSQKISRSKLSAYEGECVYWGSIKYCLSKAYLKGPEMLKRIQSKRRRSGSVPFTEQDEEYLLLLEAYCCEQGIVRHECRFAERYLNQQGLKPWHVTHEQLDCHYKKELEKMNKRIELSDSNEDVSNAAMTTYYRYMNGENVKGLLKKPTFYRHRTELFKMGVDISLPTNVKALSVKPRLVEIRPAAIPEFYVRPKLVAVK